MLALAIGLNCLIALVGFGLAGWLWRARQSLAALADALAEAERHSHHSLDLAHIPARLTQGQQWVAASRDRYRCLQRRWRQGQQVMILVNGVLVAHRWVARQRPQRSRKRRP